METIGDHELQAVFKKIERDFEEQNELINELKKQIEQFKTKNI